MSFEFDSPRYVHLRLVQHEMNPDRRKHASPPQTGRPRQQAAAEIQQKLAELVQQAAAQPPTPGFQSHLVYRVPLSKGASQDALAKALQDVGAEIVSYETDRAIIAFYEEESVADFQTAVQEYRNGPLPGRKSTKWDVFGFIEA